METSNQATVDQATTSGRSKAKDLLFRKAQVIQQAACTKMPASKYDSWSNGCTMGRMTMKSTRRALGHLLVHSLIRLLCTARFARAIRCVHLLARPVAPALRERRSLCMRLTRRFRIISTHFALVNLEYAFAFFLFFIFFVLFCFSSVFFCV